MTAVDDAQVGKVNPPRGVRITFYVALVVFAQEVTWNFFDAQVPPLLREHIASVAVVGLLMGSDNLLGIFIQPWMGNRSDNTRTPWGRRIPFLVVGMPVAALLFVLIPFSADSLPLLLGVMLAYALVCNSFKPVAESLLPDYISPERRSRANAAVKFAAGMTVIVSALISALLVDDYPTLAFAIPSVLMLISIAVVGFKIRDSDSPAYRAAVEEDRAQKGDEIATVRVRDTIADIVRDRDRSRLLFMVGILLFGSAWAALRALITPYGQEALEMSRGSAGGLTLPSGVAFLLAAFPVALLAERFGRIKVMLAGMAIFLVAMVLGTLWQAPAGAYTALALAAVGASSFLINAVVVLWNLAPSTRVVGTYTGLYTVGWAGGAFIGPALVGAMVDVTGWPFLMLNIAVVAGFAIVVVGRVSVLQRRYGTGSAL
ncbi:MFS transporter [Umezawaea endophytica]|uniref:MFS transporter n=1 Tax=Umezawaea endophytica TaxID=1654476 RepID=A0A9X3AIH8_9PSEU|nr:MFS transporter [Umezawaea endophytica]MCS7483137.1 MFS transporter [Umezawaea endophytica]